MNKNTNYYNTLGLRNTATAKEIKSAYYKISKECHPDKGGDENQFKAVTEAYKILSKERVEYDKKSKFGSNYDELSEIYDFEFNNDAKNWDKDVYEEFIKRDQLNIIVHFDDTFNGKLEYERWVYCKACKGCGKNNNAKIGVGFSKNIDANAKLNYLELSDECDFCNGTGKWGDLDCFYCSGSGKVNGANCNICKGEKRILGKQKLSGIVIPKDAKDHKIEFMGNVSKDVPNKVGHLWLIKN